MTKPTGLRTHLRAILESGAVSYDYAVTEMASQVPPGKAYRDFLNILEATRVSTAASHHQKRRRNYTKDEMIWMGARRIAQGVLSQLIKDGRVERYDDDGVSMIRLLDKGWKPREANYRSPGERVGGPMSPWTHAMAMALFEGPLPLAELREIGAAVVPAEEGLRRMDLDRDYSRRKKGYAGTGRGTRLSLDERIRRGRNKVLHQSIQNMKAFGRITVTVENGVEMARMGERPFTERDLAPVVSRSK